MATAARNNGSSRDLSGEKLSRELLTAARSWVRSEKKIQEIQTEKLPGRQASLMEWQVHPVRLAQRDVSENRLGLVVSALGIIVGGAIAGISAVVVAAGMWPILFFTVPAVLLLGGTEVWLFRQFAKSANGLKNRLNTAVKTHRVTPGKIDRIIDRSQRIEARLNNDLLELVNSSNRLRASFEALLDRASKDPYASQRLGEVSIRMEAIQQSGGVLAIDSRRGSDSLYQLACAIDTAPEFSSMSLSGTSAVAALPVASTGSHPGI